MLRKTLIALIGALSLGVASAAIAHEVDGDGNRLPGASVGRSAGALDRSFAGPRLTVRAVSAAQAANWARQSEVH